jgi:hypothetical protein
MAYDTSYEEFFTRPLEVIHEHYFPDQSIMLRYSTVSMERYIQHPGNKDIFEERLIYTYR